MLSGYHFIHFENQIQMDQYYYNNQNFLLAGVIFESNDYFQYTIRVNDTLVPKTTSIYDSDDIGKTIIMNLHNETDTEKYLNIFSPLQVAIDQSIIRLTTNNNTFIYNAYIGKLGKSSSKYYTLSIYPMTFSYFISIGFSLIGTMIVNSIVNEKEKGIKESLLLSGVYPSVFWLSWFVIYAVTLIIISFIMTILYMYTKTLSNIHPIFIFLSLTFYGFSLSILSFCISCFFHSTKTSGVISSLIIISFCCSGLTISFLNNFQKKLLSIPFSSIAFGSFINDINNFRLNGTTISFNVILHSSTGWYLLFTIFSNFIYFILLLIIDRMTSGENYIALIFSKFILKKSREEKRMTYFHDIEKDYHGRNKEIPAVEVHHIYKIYKRKSNGVKIPSNPFNYRSKYFYALNNINFKVYPGEIFSIIGKNYFIHKFLF